MMRKREKACRRQPKLRKQGVEGVYFRMEQSLRGALYINITGILHGFLWDKENLQIKN